MSEVVGVLVAIYILAIGWVLYLGLDTICRLVRPKLDKRRARKRADQWLKDRADKLAREKAIIAQRKRDAIAKDHSHGIAGGWRRAAQESERQRRIRRGEV